MSAGRRRKRSARRRAHPVPTERDKLVLKNAFKEVENAVEALRADFEELRKKIRVFDCDDNVGRRRRRRR